MRVSSILKIKIYLMSYLNFTMEEIRSLSEEEIIMLYGLSIDSMKEEV